MTTLGPAVALGFVLGLQHATDADHLVAVATIVTRSRRFRDGVLVGVLWGLGHAVTLTLAGGGVILLNVTLPEALTTGLELMVAAAIVALGVFRLRDALREFGGAAPGHLLADHDHGEGAAFHSHPHEHGGHVHAHPHVHPEPSLLSVLGGARPVALRALGIGALHGLAGTAAVSLLVLATLRAPLEGFVYLGVFALGTVAGMSALTAVRSPPPAPAARLPVGRLGPRLVARVGRVPVGGQDFRRRQAVGDWPAGAGQRHVGAGIERESAGETEARVGGAHRLHVLVGESEVERALVLD